MGNSQSNNKQNVILKTDFVKLMEQYQFHDKIFRDDFIKILTGFDIYFINNLYNYYSPNDEGIDENSYIALLENFRFRSSGKLLSYLIDICKIGSKIDSKQLKLLFNWISLRVCENFCDVMLNSYIKSSLESDEFDTDNFLSWIDRNLPDLGLDFCSHFLKKISCDFHSLIDIQLTCLDAMKQLNSSIIDLSELFILFGCLPMIYKSCPIKEEFYLQHSKHWFLLYNSNVHGLSSSRFKDTCFDYCGPLLVFFQSKSDIFCLASDVGLKEDFNTYGDSDTRFMQLKPFYQKYISGNRSPNSGVIYSHFSTKSGHRGLFVGHNPLKSAALELNEDCNTIAVLGKSQQLVAIEAWAVGYDVEKRTAKLHDIRKWEKNEVDKYKNRKIQPEKWENNPDRDILDWGGVNVRHTDMIGGFEQEQNSNDYQ